MIIKLNTDRNLTIHSEYESQIVEFLTKGVDRFSHHISSIQVYLSDENGDKAGLDDKKCVLEARIEGRPPILGTAFGANYDLALNTALSKLKNALTTFDDKLKAHH